MWMAAVLILSFLACLLPTDAFLRSEASPDNGSSSQENSAERVLQAVPLRKQYVPVQKEGRTVAYKTAYFGQVSMGSPNSSQQEFTVVFDTGSGHLILPSTSCPSLACRKHRPYNRSLSLSAVDVEYDGTPLRPDASERDKLSIAFGTGQVIGEFVEETVCLGRGSGQGTCVSLRVVIATEMSDEPFNLFAFDGVLGLGLGGLTLSPAFSLITSMSGQKPALRPRFGVYLGREAINSSGQGSPEDFDGVITFGDHDERFAASQLTWAPVVMEELGFWQVRLRSVHIGGHELEECADGGCRAIVDTGTSLLGVPRSMSRTMHRHLARPVPDTMLRAAEADATEDAAANVDCRSVPGAMLHFTLETGAMVSLSPEDYSRPSPFRMTLPASAASTTGSQGAAWESVPRRLGQDAQPAGEASANSEDAARSTETAPPRASPTPNGSSSRLVCRSLLLPLDMQAPVGPRVFIWGEPVLRRYYTAYDAEAKRIGFALASSPANVPQAALPGAEALRALNRHGQHEDLSTPTSSLLSGSPLAPLTA